MHHRLGGTGQYVLLKESCHKAMLAHIEQLATAWVTLSSKKSAD
jgi:hypothetical protein